jgi:xylulokinase
VSELTVGIDIGTTSVKAVLAGPDGEVLARTRVPHEIRTPFAGAFEHDVDQAWRAGVLAALAEVATSHEVAAACVSAMVPSLGAVAPDGSAVGPGLLYGDVRGAGPGRAERDPSQPGDSGELLSFLAWHAARAPAGSRFWPAQAVANHALCGRGAIDTTTAMTAHPLFDFTGWDAALAADAGTTPDALPDLVAGVEPAGPIRDGLAGAGALLGGGTIDALAEQLVAGAEETGDVLVLCGSTLMTWVVVDEWLEAPGLWTIPHTAPGKVLVGGPSNAGGLFLERATRWLGDGAADGLGSIDRDDLPVWLPYLRGERTPLHRPDLRASLHGVAYHHTASHLLAAAYEASGFVVRHHLDLATAAGAAPRRIVATGGGTQVGPWVQAIADATGLPVDVAAVPEGAALGAAFIARCVAGLEAAMTDARRWARAARTVEPDATPAGAIGDRYAHFRELTAAS